MSLSFPDDPEGRWRAKCQDKGRPINPMTCRLKPRHGQACGAPAVWLVTIRDAILTHELTEHRCEAHRRIGRVIRERKL